MLPAVREESADVQPKAFSSRRPIVAVLRGVLSSLALLLIAISPVQADQAFRTFIESLWPEAQAAKVSRATFDKAFEGVTPDLSLPDLVVPGREKAPVRGQAEFTRTPQDYLSKSHLINLAAQGKTLAVKHAAILDLIEKKVGVDRAVLLAVWGRETAFGAHKSPYYAVRVLATRAWLDRRKDMFRAELIATLRLLEDGTLTRETARSSWAGAMGLTQFMPTEFYTSGLDLDGDGRLDLFNSVPDALGSAAQQLKQKGWTLALPWGFEVKPGAKVDCANEGPLNAKPIAEWIKLGVARVDGSAFPAVHMQQPAYLMSPGGAYGPQFLVTENFKVIRAYNTSDLYAVFVGHLADRIGGGGDFRTPWAAIQQMPTRGIEEIQERLKGLGFAVDKIDGKIGSNTRWQIGLYQRGAKVAVDCWPTDAVLKTLRTTAPR
ncbi:MAG: lytic murein transglycosylase [Hyphomicrobiaceae bacterium]